MMLLRPIVSRHPRSHRFGVVVSGIAIGSITWLVLLVVTRFNLLTVSLGLAAVLFVTGERET